MGGVVALRSTNVDELSNQAWERLEAAVYIGDLAEELSKIAKTHDLGSLVYLLDLVRMEAESCTDHVDGIP